MILIGNGALPFAHPGPAGPAAPGTDAAARRAATPGTGAPHATIPAAAPERTGHAVNAPHTGGSKTSIPAVLAKPRADAAENDTADRQCAALTAAGRDSNLPQHLEHRRAPAPPLESYAAVPMEVTAEIRRLRNEIAELKEQLGKRERKPEEARGGTGAGDEPTATDQPDNGAAPAEAAERRPFSRANTDNPPGFVGDRKAPEQVTGTDADGTNRQGRR